ncbi:hypothetical protein GYMLUDRAFT_236716 [Collybiopsis luxurians FD-317 M1]|nr:hypothetical protein GYMLUDRAFT_236716 [Collybiopsis luxurians FD-317 M1]
MYMAPKIIGIESDDELDALAPHTVSSFPPKSQPHLISPSYTSPSQNTAHQKLSSLSAKAQGKQPAHSTASAPPKMLLFRRISSSPFSDTQEQVHFAAEKMEQIVEQYRKSEITVMDTFHAIKDSTTDAAVAKDCLPEDPELDPDHVSAQEAANAALWATFEASLLPDTPAAPATFSNISSSALIKLLANSIKPSSGLSTALLTAAPHLASLSSPISAAIHVQKTWELRALIAEESNLDPLLHSISAQSFVDPLPRSLLRLIIKDQFVDFEKVHAAVTQPSLVHDDSKDFRSEYKLVWKESEIRRLPLTTEVQWFQVFQAWLVPVLLVYPHYRNELLAYQTHITTYFCTSSDPTVAIRMDKKMRNLAANTLTDLADSSSFHEAFLKEYRQK